MFQLILVVFLSLVWYSCVAWSYRLSGKDMFLSNRPGETILRVWKFCSILRLFSDLGRVLQNRTPMQHWAQLVDDLLITAMLRFDQRAAAIGITHPNSIVSAALVADLEFGLFICILTDWQSEFYICAIFTTNLDNGKAGIISYLAISTCEWIWLKLRLFCQHFHLIQKKTLTVQR